MIDSFQRKKGLTLVGVLVMMGIVMVLLTFLGKAVPFLTRTRFRSESKASFAKSAEAIGFLIGRRFNQVLTERCPNDGDDFRNRFNAQPVTFPGGVTRLLIQRGGDPELNAFPTPPTSLPDLASYLASCRREDSVRIPPSNEAKPFLFCLALSHLPNSQRSTLTDFIDSEAAFIPVRIDLFSAETPQDRKVMGQSLSCDAYRALSNSGRGDQDKQIKMSYTAFWKRANNDSSDLGFFSFKSSSILNIVEIQ